MSKKRKIKKKQKTAAKKKAAKEAGAKPKFTKKDLTKKGLGAKKKEIDQTKEEELEEDVSSATLTKEENLEEEDGIDEETESEEIDEPEEDLVEKLTVEEKKEASEDLDKAWKKVVKKKVDNKMEYNEEDVNEKLTEIYENEDGSMPDMKNFKKIKRSKLVTAFFVLLFSCLFLAVVAWVGFFIFQPQARFSEEDVILSISGEEEVSAGDEVRYRVRYRNAQNVPLAKTVLQVRYPEGFVFSEASVDPNNDSNDEWILGSIEEHGSGYIDITGKMYGDVGKKQSFRVFLNYYPSNFSSEFQKVTNVNIEIIDSPVELTLQAPEEIVPGGGTEFVVEIKNLDEEALENLAVVFEGGDYFVKKSSTPDSDEYNEYRWSINKLEDKATVSVLGSFNIQDGEDVSEVGVKAKLLGWKDDKKEGDGYVWAEASSTMAVSQTALSMNLAINGTLNDFSVQPGEVLNSSLVLKNIGDEAINNARIRIVLDGPSHSNLSILKWTDLDDALDGRVSGEQLNEQTRRGEITWTSAQLSDLQAVDSGEDVIIDFSLPIKDMEDIDLTQFSTYEIKATAELQYEVAGEEKILSSNPITMVINSDMEVEVRDEVDTNSAGKDVHTITWLLSNTFHELQNILVEADLYGDIIWNNDDLIVPAGEAVFDEEKKKLTWTIEQMPTSVDVLALQFEVVLNSKNPSQTNLASKVRFKAKDIITGEEIIMVGDEILLSGTVE